MAGILIGCEFSGRVRDAFIRRGYDAISCDLVATEIPGPHLQMDIRDALKSENWKASILHPPCTNTAVSGARWFGQKQAAQEEALSFNLEIWKLAPPKKVLEQPISVTPRVLGPCTQIIQPYDFDVPERKTTCLWIAGLPLLAPTSKNRWNPFSLPQSVHHEPPGPNRQRNRSRTYLGIAEAMASQWGPVIFDQRGGR